MNRFFLSSLAVTLCMLVPMRMYADTTAIVNDSTKQTSTLTNDSSYRAFVLDSLRIAADAAIDHERARNNRVEPEAVLGVMIPIIAIISTFLFLWRSVEAKRKVRIAMVERGMDPGMLDAPVDENSRKYSALRWGMLFTGVGLGLLVGFLVSSSLDLSEESTTGIVMSCALFFGGAGLIVYHRVATKIEK